MMCREASYTHRAATAVIEAARSEHDFGGWLAEVLATAAAELGSTAALTACRPGSWKPTSSSNSCAGRSAGTTITSPTTEGNERGCPVTTTVTSHSCPVGSCSPRVPTHHHVSASHCGWSHRTSRPTCTRHMTAAAAR